MNPRSDGRRTEDRPCRWEALVDRPILQGLSEEGLIQLGLAPMAGWCAEVAARRKAQSGAENGAAGACEGNRNGEKKRPGPLKIAMLRELVFWEVQYKTIVELSRVCSEHGIAAAFLKGTDLNLRCYPLAGLRPMVDVDLLVNGPDLGRMAELMVDLGYSSLDAADAPAAHVAFQTRWSSPHGGMVEIHSSPDWSEAIGVGTGELLARRQLVGYEGTQVPVLDGPDMLMNVATHAVRDMRAVWRRPVVDAYFAIERLDLAWERVVECAREWGARPALYALLLRANRFAGAEVPDEVLRELDAGGIAGRTARWLGGWLDLPAALQGDWPERAVRLAMVETVEARVRFAREYLGLRMKR